MKKFYAVHCDHWEERDRIRTVYCKTHEKAVELAIDFLLNDNNSFETMRYTLWEENPIYDVNDDADKERFISDVRKHFEENDSIVGFGKPGTDAYVENDEYGNTYIEYCEFED